MRVFISASGLYLVEEIDRTFSSVGFSSLVQAVAYCQNHGRAPIFTWEVSYV